MTDLLFRPCIDQMPYVSGFGAFPGHWAAILSIRIP